MRSRPEARKPPTIVLRVATLVAVAVLPVLVFSGFMLTRYSSEQRDRYLLQLQATARSVSLAIDTKIEQADGILEALLASSLLKERDWPRLYEEAKQSIADVPGAWVVLYAPSGQLILATDVPFGTKLPLTSLPEVIRKVVDSRQPHISGLGTRGFDKSRFVGIFRPIIEEDAVTGVIAIAFPPAIVSQVLHSQPMAVAGIGGVIDRNGALIARTVAEAEFVGHAASPDLLASMNGREEGIYESRSLEG
jgi:two-component system, sensor histidine kinase